MFFNYLVLNTDLLYIAMIGRYFLADACAVDSQQHGYLKNKMTDLN